MDYRVSRAQEVLYRIKSFWLDNFYLPWRKWVLAKAVGFEMDKRLSKHAVEAARIAQASRTFRDSQFQCHIDALSDENARLKRLVGKAIHLGFDPDSVPDNEILNPVPRSEQDR